MQIEAAIPVKNFRRAAAAVWAGTLSLTGGIVLWFSQTLLKKGDDADRPMAAGMLALARRRRLGHG